MAYAVIDDARSFGQAVRAARKERGLSQRAVAEQCGCSQRFVSELERGKPTAELEKALALLAHLGLTLTAERRQPTRDGREAVERLVDGVTERLERQTRKATSLADYLEE
jgi:y4mF family transcriptional regulator